MKKVLFLIGSLEGGGAEKTLTDLVGNLDKTKYDITVVSIKHKGIYIDEIKKHAHYKALLNIYKKEGHLIDFLSNKIMKIMNRLPGKFLYKLFIHEVYDVEIAYLEGMSTKIISGSNNKLSKKYAWVHTDLQTHSWSTVSYKNLADEKECYEKFDDIFCVSSDVRDSFEEKYSVTAAVQLNVLDELNIIEKSKQQVADCGSANTFRIITVGRFVAQKAYDRLLRVHKKLMDNGFVHELLIVGDGDQRELLTDYVKANDLGKSVRMVGFQPNPYQYMNLSDLFVCSSITEGYSTVATEAVILGLPVVTTNCAGMNDLLGDSVYGIITENSEEALYEGLKRMLSDGELYKHYKQKAKERSSAFKLTNRINEFENILDR